MNPWGAERDDLRIGLLACALQVLFEFEPTWEPRDFLLMADPAAATRGGRSINGWEDSDLSTEKLNLIGQQWQIATV